MSADEIKEELIAQNLSSDHGSELKVIYIFQPKQDKRFTSCILEVSPTVHKVLFGGRRIFLKYAICSFADYIRILQCYKCLKFGHMARNCNSKPACGHCAGEHDTKDCVSKDLPPICFNCKVHQGFNDDTDHEATDAKRCPILDRKIKDRITSTSYG